MNNQIGIRLSAAIAQNGIFGRRFAAAHVRRIRLRRRRGVGAAAALRPVGAAGGGGRCGRRRRAGRRCRRSGLPAGGLTLLAATQAERGASIARPLQQVFGDLCHELTMSTMRGSERQRGSGQRRPAWPGTHRRSRAATIGVAPASTANSGCAGRAGERRVCDEARPSARHLCTTSRNHDTGVPDCTSSLTCGATTVRANVHEGRHRADGSPWIRDDRDEPNTQQPTSGKADGSPMLAIDILEVARHERGVPRLVLRRHRAHAARSSPSASAVRWASRSRGARRCSPPSTPSP